MNVLAEGVETIKLACSLVLLIPAIGIVLLGRRRLWLITAWTLTVTTIAWLRFAIWWPLEPRGTLHVLAGIVVLGLAVLAFQRDQLATDLAATIGVALVAGWTWEPCVGSELGEILNGARRQPWPQLAPSLLYFIGLFLPLILLANLPALFPKLEDYTDRRSPRIVGLGIIAVVGSLVAVTLFDDLAGELARRSSY